MRLGLPFFCLVLVVLGTGPTWADEVSPNEVIPPGPNKADEPRIDSFSMSAAISFLDRASLDWSRNRQCFACHTNYLYLVAWPAIPGESQTQREVRDALEELVEQRWSQKGPRWDAEVVMSAAVLALNDAATTGKLHSTTRKALDRMWTVQREDGGVDWLKCGWPPMESDDDFGASMMALAVGVAPGDYRQTVAAKTGLARLRVYFEKNPAPTLHHRAMMLWADSYLGDLLTDKQRQATRQELLELQQNDGGWALASLGDWTRADGKEQDRATSDGYGTGFVIYVLHRAGVPAEDPRILKGIDWLKANQRASGRWYTRSLKKDNRHFITHAGSAFATLAIAVCQESDTPVRDAQD